MSTVAKLRGSDFDSMVQRGAFDCLDPMKIELVHGELRFTNPAGPVHEGEVEYLTDWSYENTNRGQISLRVQSSFNCGDHRPEPDLLWFRRQSSKRIRPSHADVLLAIEVAESSLAQDLGEKAELYAEHGIAEYWVVDIAGEQVYVHRGPSQGRYQSITQIDRTKVISPLCQPHASLQLGPLFDLDN